MKLKPSDLKVTKAELKDFDELKILLHKANDYSIELCGIPQWTIWTHVYGGLQSELSEGDVYVVRGPDGEITSAIAISTDEKDWGDAGQDEQALFLYKLMKDPAKAMPGEGARLIRFAAEQALSRGKKFLRCDTATELVGLIEYYEKLGFQPAGSFVYESSGRNGILLEAEAESVLINSFKDND